MLDKEEITGIKEVVKEWSDWVLMQKGKLEELETREAKLNRNILANETLLGNLELARTVFVNATRVTQSHVKKFIEEIVGLALQAVYGSEYDFKLKFEVKRNQSEISPVIIKNGEEFSPKDECGGGIIDVASFAFRVVMWALSGKQSRATFILDEPFKFVSKDLTEYISAMLTEISKLLGLQIIMVSHDEGLIEVADRSWTVTQDGGISTVELNVIEEK